MGKTLGGLILLPAIALAGCQPVYAPVMGALYMNVKGPIATTDEAAATKEGRSCARSYLGMVAVGDASIQAAKAAGGITEVSSVDHQSNNILGIVADFCTIVHGK